MRSKSHKTANQKQSMLMAKSAVQATVDKAYERLRQAETLCKGTCRGVEPGVFPLF